MKLSEINNPKKITGILLWNNGKPLEIETNENTSIQETNGRIEIWQQMSEQTILRVCYWNKKSITHYVINNEFVLKY